MVEMTDREKFLFDLQGFLHVSSFLSDEEVAALNTALDAIMDKLREDGNYATGESTTLLVERHDPIDYATVVDTNDLQ